METVTLAGAVIAVTGFIKTVVPSVSGWITVVIAAALGLAAGYSGIEGFTPMTGLLAGLMAVGAVTTVDRISTK